MNATIWEGPRRGVPSPVRRRFSGLFLLLALLFLAPACGGGGDTTPSNFGLNNPSGPAADTGTVQVDFDLQQRKVPSEVTQFRFTGVDSAGTTLFGPVLRDKAAQVVLQGVPTGVTRLLIDYLDGNVIVGQADLAVQVSVGGTTVIEDPPFTDVTVRSLSVSPATATIVQGQTQQYTATALFSNGQQMDVTAQAAWASSNAAAASIDAGGLATGVGVGDTSIAATLSGVISPAASLTVTGNVTVTQVNVTPATATVAVGGTQQLAAEAVFSDGSTRAVTGEATWSSSAEAVATVDAAGLATGVAGGTADISANFGGQTGSATLTVETPPVLESITVTPATLELPVGLTQQYTATGNFSDGSTNDLTASVNWSLEQAGDSATITAGGLLTATAPGPVTVRATQGDISGTASLTVTPVTLVRVEVTPDPASVPAGGFTVQLAARAFFSDGSDRDVTSEADWLSFSPAVASVDQNGLVTSGAEAGQAVMRARFNNVDGEATVDVTNSVLTGITIQGARDTMIVGETNQYTATGTFQTAGQPDQQMDLTRDPMLTWRSSDMGVATISNDQATKGLATAVGAGTTFIQASRGSVSSEQDALVVQNRVPVSLAIVPVGNDSPDVPQGLSRIYRATLTFNDGDVEPVTSAGQVDWSVASTGGFTGTAFLDGSFVVAHTGAAGEQAVVTATAAANASASDTLQSAVLSGLDVTPTIAFAELPDHRVIGVGERRQIRMQATLSNGMTLPLLRSDIGISQFPSGNLADIAPNTADSPSPEFWVVDGTFPTTPPATVTIGIFVPGDADPNLPGASLQNIQVLNVASVDVVPFESTILVGGTQQYQFLVNYTDGPTGIDLATLALWTSSNTARATVDQNGLATGVSSGATINITATLPGTGGFSDFGLLTVNAP